MNTCLNYISSNEKKTEMKSNKDFEHINKVVLSVVLVEGDYILLRGAKTYEEAEEILGYERVAEIVNDTVCRPIVPKEYLGKGDYSSEGLELYCLMNNLPC